MTGITPEAFVLGLSGLGAGLAMICGIGTGIGQGVSETPTIFAFVVSIILMFANPLVGLL